MTITSIVVSVSHTVSRVITVDGSIDKTQPSIPQETLPLRVLFGGQITCEL